MKIMIRKTERGFTAYVPKKDLEQPIVGLLDGQIWGRVVTLANGWRLDLPAMPADTRLPVTVEARKLPDDE